MGGGVSGDAPRITHPEALCPTPSSLFDLFVRHFVGPCMTHTSRRRQYFSKNSPLLLRRGPTCLPPTPAPPMIILPRTPESLRGRPLPPATPPLPRLSLPLPTPLLAGVAALAHAGRCCLVGSAATSAAATSLRTTRDGGTLPPIPNPGTGPGLGPYAAAAAANSIAVDRMWINISDPSSKQ